MKNTDVKLEVQDDLWIDVIPAAQDIYSVQPENMFAHFVSFGNVCTERCIVQNDDQLS